MSDLRNNIETLRREYRAAKYPGDLAAEMLGNSRAGHGRWIWGLSAAAAAVVAGAVLVSLLRDREPRNLAWNDPPDQVGIIEEIVEVSYIDMPPLSPPQLPAEMVLAPEAPSFSFSAPSFTLLEEDASSPTMNPPTTQELI